VRFESRLITGTVVDKLKAYVKDIERDLRSIAGSSYPLTEVRVNLEDGTVIAVWKDYTDDENIASSYVDELITAVEELKNATNELDRAGAITKLTELNEFFKKYGVTVKEVAKSINQVRQLKEQGLTPEEIANQLGLPLFLVNVIYEK